MGNKTYFEFLEEEFQVLTSQLQSSLAKIATDRSYDNAETAELVAVSSKQLHRCQAVFQQLRNECKGDAEYKDRVYLYKTQLYALKAEHETHQ